MADFTQLSADLGLLKTGITNLATAYQNTLDQLKQITTSDADVQKQIDDLHAQATDDLSQITTALTPAQG